MPVKIQRLINVLMLVLPWLSLPFLGVSNIKRFFRASLLIVFLEALTVQIGKRRKWWVFYNKPNSYLFNEFPFNFGPHLVGSMWILKWTYGNFKRFMLLNAVVDAIFAFPLNKLLEKMKVVTLVRLNHWQFFIYIFFKAPLFYWSQYFFENRKSIDTIQQKQH